MKNLIAILNLTILLQTAFTSQFKCSAQSGLLDITFDSDGIATTAIGLSDDKSNCVAVQNDGKIIQAGRSYNGINNDFAIVRFNTNGSLDSSFDADGKLTTSIIPSSDDEANGIAIQGNGKIVLAGNYLNGSTMCIALVRYNIDGSLDTTFDSDGIVNTSFGNNDAFANTIALQADGKIVIGGYSYNPSNSEFSVLRYNINGSIDSTFDYDGIVTTNIGQSEHGQSLLIQPNGKIVLAGFNFNGFDNDIVIIRYNTNGSLDSTFDTDGVVVTDIGNSNNFARGVVLTTNGKLVVTGSLLDGSDYKFLTIQFNTDGSLDNSFDFDGVVITSLGPGTLSFSQSVIVQPNNQILIAGYSWLSSSSSYDIALLRYNTNGTLDSTFDNDGIVTTDIGGSTLDFGNALGIQADGKIVVAGISSDGTISKFSLERYLNSITVDINQNEIKETEVFNYPNPFSNFTTIKSTKDIHNGVICVYNLNGHLVHSVKNLFGNTFNLNRDNLSSGVYILRLFQDNVILLEDKLLISDL